MRSGKRIVQWVVTAFTFVYAVGAFAAPPAAISAPVSYNGHSYVLLGNSDWSDAEQAAEAMGGTLAIINNQAENDFLYSTFSSYAGVQRGLWIGLYDPTGIVHDDGPGGSGSRHAADFVWASGAPVAYTNWIGGEPNDQDGEYYGYIEFQHSSSTGSQGGWNDLANNLADESPVSIFGVVEMVPEPGSLVLFSGGLVALLVRRRRT